MQIDLSDLRSLSPGDREARLRQRLAEKLTETHAGYPVKTDILAGSLLSTARLLLDRGETSSAKDQIEAAQYLIANRARIEADALSLLVDQGEPARR